MDKDRIKGSAQQAKGKVKEVAGKITGDAKLEGEGKAESRRKNPQRRRRDQRHPSRKVSGAFRCNAEQRWEAELCFLRYSHP